MICQLKGLTHNPKHISHSAYVADVKVRKCLEFTLGLPNMYIKSDVCQRVV